MKNMSDADKAIWLSDYSQKQYTAIINGIDYGENKIDAESLKITEILEDGSQLNFIGCKSKKLEIAIIDTNTSFLDKTIIVKAIASLDGATTSEVILFNGRILEVKQKSQTDIMVNIVAYDHMAEVIATNFSEWYKSLSFPMTLREFRKAIPASVNLKDEQLPLDDVVLLKTIEAEEMSGKDILGAIASMNGMYCDCDSSGQIYFKALAKKSTSSVIPEFIDNEYYIKAEYQDYSVETINKVQIRSEENDIGAIYGSGSNAYVLQGNFLLYGKGTEELTSIAQRLYSIVSDIVYTPAKIECKARPWVELGDLIKVNTEKNIIYTYVMQRTWQGMHFISDTYQAKQEAQRDEQINSVNNSIIQLRGKANKLTRDIEHMSSEIYNEDGSSKLTQTANAIEMQIETLTKQIDGEISTYYTREVPTLENYPAWDFTYNIPCNNTVKTTNDLKFIYNDEYYRRNLRALVYNELTGLSYRFKTDETGAWFWEEIANTEYATLMKRVTSLEIKDGEIESSIEEITYDVSDLNTAQSTLSSRITQTASQISSEVSRATNAEGSLSSRITQNADNITLKVTKGSVSSEISQEAGRISIKSNRLEISSTNFSLATDGTMTCKNANITGYTTTAQLNATNANVTNLSGSVASLNTVVAGKASIDQLNAVSASIKNLDASYIKSGTIDANRISVDTITSKISAASGISAKTITCSSYTVQSPAGSQRLYTLRPAVFTLGSRSRVILSADFAE